MLEYGIPEIPDVQDGTLRGLRINDTLSRALPPMPKYVMPYTGASPDEIAAAKLADQIRASYAISRAYKNENANRARARERALSRALEKHSGTNRNIMNAMVRRAMIEEQRYMRNFARYMGLGPDLY